MKDFKKQGSFGGQRGGGNFSRPPFRSNNRPSGGRDDGFGRSQMFEAICANCGKKCEVPFRPNGQKPVYCRDCFGKQDRPPTGGNFPRRDFNSRPSFQAPREQLQPRDGRIDEIKRQLEGVNAKLDQLLSATRGANVSKEKAPARDTEKEIEVPKAKAAKPGKKKAAPKAR